MAPNFYVSGRKAGTVKIQVRSRSEQASPTNGLQSVPRSTFRGGIVHDDVVRSQQVIHPQSAIGNRQFNTSASVDGAQV